MSALRQAIDTTTLGWIKPELDETLRQARHEIEAFAEGPVADGADGMRACAAFLHQVHGTLRMVELHAPALVAAEMETLADALAEGSVAQRDDACAALMRGVVLLPDYLERLQGGHKDVPLVLLPLLNELRGVRGKPAMSESMLFQPDLERALPDAAPRAAGLRRQERQSQAAPLLASLDQALSSWPAGGPPSDAAALASSTSALVPFAANESDRRMLWVAASLAMAVRDGAVQGDAALRDAFAATARQARRGIEDANDDGFAVRFVSLFRVHVVIDRRELV